MTKPAFLERSKQMHISDVVGLLCLTEKFKFSDLLVEYKVEDEKDKTKYITKYRLNEIDSFSPVYKSLYDKYLGADSEKYVSDRIAKIGNKEYIRLYDDTDINNKLPIFRTYFDWTSGSARDAKYQEESPFNGNNWPIQVEIRIEFSEPRTDTIQAIGSRRFLRGGIIQFLITAPVDVVEYITIDEEDKYVSGKPMGSIFRIAQFYIDKYGSTDAMQLLRDIPDIEKGIANISIGTDQFENTNIHTREQIMEILFPEADFDKHNIHYVKKDVRKDPQDPPNLIWVEDPGDPPMPGASVYSGGNRPDFEPGLDAKSNEGDYYVLISDFETFRDKVKSFRTIAAVVTNIRFVPKDRHPARLFNPTYGLAVSIPFTFEQQK